MVNEKDVRRVWNAKLSSTGYRSMIDNAVYHNAPRIAELVNDELKRSNRIDVENVIDEVINRAIERALPDRRNA